MDERHDGGLSADTAIVIPLGPVLAARLRAVEAQLAALADRREEMLAVALEAAGHAAAGRFVLDLAADPPTCTLTAADADQSPGHG